jgi:hypothetical protein
LHDKSQVRKRIISSVKKDAEESKHWTCQSARERPIVGQDPLVEERGLQSPRMDQTIDDRQIQEVSFNDIESREVT